MVKGVASPNERRSRPVLIRLPNMGLLRLLCVAWIAVVVTDSSFAQLCGQDYTDRVTIVREAASRLEGNRPRLVLVGSSSFRKWPETDTVFSQYDVINAGFGGSCFEDLWVWREPLLFEFQPNVVMVYEGDNDINDGLPLGEVLRSADKVLRDIRRRLPDAALVVVAPKASIARQHLAPQYIQFNRSLDSLCQQIGGIDFVSFWDDQHREDGTIRLELFMDDMLHLNAKGYTLWVEGLRERLPWLDPRWGP